APRTIPRSLLGRREAVTRAPATAPIHGSARLGRKTKELVKRLRPGEVAIIDHADIDRIAAEELIATDVPAVVNVAASSTGRYPNPGPLLLAEAGIRLIDVPGSARFQRPQDRHPVSPSPREGRVGRPGPARRP